MCCQYISNIFHRYKYVDYKDDFGMQLPNKEWTGAVRATQDGVSNKLRGDSYSDVTWGSQRLKSLGNRLFVELFVRPTKENM